MLKPSTTTAIAVIYCCGAFLIMLKWIKNSKGTVTNESTGCKGISITKFGKYRAYVRVRNNGKSPYIVHIGNYETLKEAKKARVNYILDLL